MVTPSHGVSKGQNGSDVAPIRKNGSLGPWQLTGVWATAAVIVLLVAERVYVRSVIHTDRKLGWREAWGQSN